MIYINDFVKDENGAEVVEYIGLIAIAAALLAAAVAVVGKIKTTANETAETADGKIKELFNGE